MLLLLFISFVVPIRLAFTDEETLTWLVVYAFVDLMFLLDILIIFFTSYTSKQREVVTHKQIAVNYFKSWFAFDILSIIPLDYIVLQDEEVKLNSLIRVAKIARLYKIFRLFRMIKLVKILKQNRAVMRHLSEKLRISSGQERLIIFFCYFCLFTHVSANFFIFLARLEEDE